MGIVVFALWSEQKEPECDGKKLSEWLEIFDKGFWTIEGDPFQRARTFEENATADAKKAVIATRMIGTNALPWLLKWAAEDHEKWERTVLKAGEKLPNFLHAYPTALSIVRNSGRKQRAALVGFAILGQKAAPAVPALMTLVEKSKSRSCRMAAIYSLGVLRETARPALPCLKKHARTNGVGERISTVWTIRTIEEGNLATVGTTGVQDY